MTHVATVRSARSVETAPKLGLRFDRGRTELVLDAPLTLATGLRVDAMRTELAPLAGRLSLTDGWRAFRHRRSSLVSATISIGVGELRAQLGQLLQLEPSVIALGASAISLGLSGDALALAVEIEWGFDDEDLLIAPAGARAIPAGPRAALALVHDLAARFGATFDAERGVLRIAKPVRAVLASALVPAGLRVPATVGLAQRASIQGDRLVLTVDRTPGGVPSASRDALERARANASATQASIESGIATSDPSPLAIAARALTDALSREPVEARRLEEAADDYATRERHASLASRALAIAAERLDARAAMRLANLAIERGGLVDPAQLARAIELAARDRDPQLRELPWEKLSRSLEGASPVVARARGIALERADRPSDALDAFTEAARMLPDDVLVREGIGRALLSLGRADEAITSLDRAADLAEGEHASRIRLQAARAALTAGHVEGGLARFGALIETSSPTVTTLYAHGDLARALAQHRGLDAAITVDGTLPAITDALGAIYAPESTTALRWAIARALKAREPALARSLARALARIRGDDGEIDLLESKLAEVEALALASTDVASLRARADAYRRTGEHLEAARALIEVFAQTKDGAMLRAAIELADRASDASGRLAVFDRALALLPAGPARDAIAARR